MSKKKKSTQIYTGECPLCGKPFEAQIPIKVGTACPTCYFSYHK